MPEVNPLLNKINGLERSLSEIRDRMPPPGDGGGDTNAMRDRLTRLEGVVAGLADRVTTLTVVLGFLLTALLGVTTYAVTRMDKLEDKIDDIPGKLANSNRDLITTLSSAITATRQQAPQVLLVPNPTSGHAFTDQRQKDQ